MERQLAQPERERKSKTGRSGGKKESKGLDINHRFSVILFKSLIGDSLTVPDVETFASTQRFYKTKKNITYIHTVYNM